ncbi:MAG: DNA starvation/stationary phase protection protein [Planctomycetota bacterium]
MTVPSTTDTQATASALNDLLADLQVSYYKIRHFHWLVKGTTFYTLHEQFEKMYEAWAEHIDEVAERLIAIDHEPLKTLAANIERASIGEQPTTPDAMDMARELADDFAKVIHRIDDATEAAEKAGLRSTENTLDDIRDGVDKHRWMLRRFTA